MIIYDKELTQSEVTARWHGGDGIEWTTGYEASGTYLSNSFDSAYPNLDWEHLCFNVDIPANTTLVIKVRTADCPGVWGSWSTALANGETITETGRFIQWKGEFATTNNLATPKVFDLSIYNISQKTNKIIP